jgi:hypothetical protein
MSEVVTQAPTVTPPASSSIWVNSGIAVMSTKMLGCTSRRFNIGPSD